MTTQRRRRLLMIGAMVLGVGVAAALILNAFRENLVFFYAPAQVLAGEPPAGRNVRLGGLVEEGSILREANGLTVRFSVTDLQARVPVTYKGILPDLFRDGQGVVVLGRMGLDGVFAAEEVLAKHDENYMPPEVAESLKVAEQAGVPAARVNHPTEKAPL